MIRRHILVFGIHLKLIKWDTWLMSNWLSNGIYSASVRRCMTKYHRFESAWNSNAVFSNCNYCASTLFLWTFTYECSWYVSGSMALCTCIHARVCTWCVYICDDLEKANMIMWIGTSWRVGGRESMWLGCTRQWGVAAHTHHACLKKAFADKCDKVKKDYSSAWRIKRFWWCEQIICAIQLEHLYSV